MRVVSFDDHRIGVLHDGRVADVTDLVAQGQTWPPTGMLRFIQDFAALRPAVEHRVESGPSRSVDEVRLGAPIPWPSKLLAFPANYQRHIDEMNSRSRADVNGFFLKSPASICGPNDAITLPDVGDIEVHHECELAIVIGRGGRHISADQALEHIFGFTCLIDVTVRGPQERVARKSFDTFTPTGPWITTADEVADPDDLTLELRVNGEVRQRASTSDLLVNVADMIAMSAAITTLFPGDVIATGTPDGVGPLRAGDVVDIEIESVGAMTVDVVASTTPPVFDLGWPRAGRN